MALISLLAFYQKHLEEELLPFWVRVLDHEHGGIYTWVLSKKVCLSEGSRPVV